jgi:hypothetical protein
MGNADDIPASRMLKGPAPDGQHLAGEVREFHQGTLRVTDGFLGVLGVGGLVFWADAINASIWFCVFF